MNFGGLLESQKPFTGNPNNLTTEYMEEILKSEPITCKMTFSLLFHIQSGAVLPYYMAPDSMQ